MRHIQVQGPWSLHALLASGDCPVNATAPKLLFVMVVMVIGDTSDPAQELFWVRGAVLLRDGSIAIANNGTHEARLRPRWQTAAADRPRR
jgi:hypothetical protein